MSKKTRAGNDAINNPQLLRGLASIVKYGFFSDSMDGDGKVVRDQIDSLAHQWDFSLWLECNRMFKDFSTNYLFPFHFLREKMVRLIPADKWQIDVLCEDILSLSHNYHDPDIFWGILECLLPRCKDENLHRELWRNFRQWLRTPIGHNALFVFFRTCSSWFAQTLLDTYPSYFCNMTVFPDILKNFTGKTEIAQIWLINKLKSEIPVVKDYPATRSVWKRVGVNNDRHSKNLNCIRYQLEGGVRPKSWTDKWLCQNIYHLGEACWLEGLALLAQFGIDLTHCVTIPFHAPSWECALATMGLLRRVWTPAGDRYLLWTNAAAKRSFSLDARARAHTVLLCLVRMGLGLGFRDLREAILTRVMNAYVADLRWKKWGDVDCR